MAVGKNGPSRWRKGYLLLAVLQAVPQAGPRKARKETQVLQVAQEGALHLLLTAQPRKGYLQVVRVVPGGPQVLDQAVLHLNRLHQALLPAVLQSHVRQDIFQHWVSPIYVETSATETMRCPWGPVDSPMLGLLVPH